MLLALVFYSKQPYRFLLILVLFPLMHLCHVKSFFCLLIFYFLGFMFQTWFPQPELTVLFPHVLSSFDIDYCLCSHAGSSIFGSLCTSCSIFLLNKLNTVIYFTNVFYNQLSAFFFFFCIMEKSCVLYIARNLSLPEFELHLDAES